MRSEGNCGIGEAGPIDEPREPVPHIERVEEVAWHRGATASATGTEAVRRRREQAIRDAAALLHRIADRVGDRFDYVIADAGPFREAAEALDAIVAPEVEPDA